MTTAKTDNQKLRVGIVGAAFIGQMAHIQNLWDIEHVDLVAVAELRDGLRKAVSEKYGIREQYKSHLELISHAKLDLVYVVTRRHHTGPIALDLLEAGFNVFTEKPMAQTLDKAMLLADKAREKDLFYAVGFMRRYDDGVVKAKRIFSEIKDSGRLGRVLSGRVFLSAGGDYCNIKGDIKSNEAKPMEVIWPVAPTCVREDMRKDYEHFVNVNGHDINLMRYIFGEPQDVNSVYYRKDRGALVVFDYKDFGVTYSWSDTLQLTKWEEGIEICFERGSLKIDLPPAFLQNVPAKVTVQEWQSRDDIRETVYDSDWSWAFRNEDFMVTKDCLEGNLSRTNGADCVNDMILIEKIWKAISDSKS